MAHVRRELRPVHYVHEDALFCERIRKELRHQKLYTKFTVNPFRPIHVITGKPNSYYDNAIAQEAADPYFLNLIERAAAEPYRKFLYPQTEAQEHGWLHKPLIDGRRDDLRFYNPKQDSEITKYMHEAWKLKAQILVNRK